jgi:hypothetical protein
LKAQHDDDDEPTQGRPYKERPLSSSEETATVAFSNPKGQTLGRLVKDHSKETAQQLPFSHNAKWSHSEAPDRYEAKKF